MQIIDFLLLLRWWGLIFVIGLTFLPLTARIFPKFFDKGYAFSKVFGIILISYAIYIAGSFHLLRFSFPNIVFLWILIAASVWFPWWKEIKNIKANIRIYLFEELIFFSSLLVWSIVRSYSPDIHDLEKFMDFGFINSILRSDYFPPKDMWFTPLPINYYYFGHLFTSVLTKLSNIPSFITFNLMLATVFAFCVTLSFSLGSNLFNILGKFSLRKLIVGGALTAFLVSLSGNLETIYSLFKGYNGESPVPFWKLALSLPTFPNSYWYPNATRFIFHTIHEFPSYSFVVADLHGHVLDIPIVLAILAILAHAFMSKSFGKVNLVALSLLLSVSYMTNAWDGLIYLMLGGFFIFGLMFSLEKSQSFDKKFIYSAFNSLRYFLPLVILFLVFSLVFNKSFSPFASGIGLNCSPEFLIRLQKIGPFVFEKGQCMHSPIWQLGILYGFFLFMFVSFLLFLRKRSTNTADQLVLIFSFFSLFLLIIPEFFYLKDIYTGYFRANTMFKLAYQAFIMLSFSSAYIIARIATSVRDFKTKTSRISLPFFAILGTVLFLLVSIYPYFSIPSGYGDFKKYHGLDGTAYLQQIKPYDYSSIMWLNKNVSGQPVILEAQGDSYTDFARISANTGLPTVLGWTVHEWLWRGAYDIPASRFGDIKNLYESPSVDLTKSLIKKYNISYIYIGVLEKEKYKLSERKFLSLGKIVYENPGAKIYKVN